MFSKIKLYAKPLSFSLLLVWLIALILSKANPYLTLASKDGGSFLYIGSRMLVGDRLYVDVWDHKGPGIFFINWLGLLLVNNSRWGVWALEFVFLYFGFFLGYLGVRKVWGDAIALPSAVLAAYGLMNVIEKGNLTEEYPLLFNFFALWLFLTRREKNSYLIYTLIGASFGISFMFRANNGGVQVAIGLAMLILGLLRSRYGDLFKQLSGLASGALGILGLVSLYFVFTGTFNEFIEGAFTYNLFEVRDGNNLLSGFLKGWELFGAISYLMALGYFSALYRLFVLLKKRQRDGFEIEVLMLIAILWPLEILLSSLSGRNYSHYFVCWVPAIFLLTSYALSVFASEIFTRRVLAFFETVWVYYLILIVSMLFSWMVVGDYVETINVLLFNRQYGIDRQHDIANYIRETTQPDDKVLVWGWGAGINFLSRREAPSSHIFYPLSVENPINTALSEKFYQDLLTNRPVLVIDMSSTKPDYLTAINPVRRAEQAKKNSRQYYPPYYNEVLDYIYENYELEKTIRGHDIYRLKTP